MLEHLPFVCLQETLNSPSSQHQGSSPGLLCLLPSLEREDDSQESQSHVGKTTQTGDIALPAQPQLPARAEAPGPQHQHSSTHRGVLTWARQGSPEGALSAELPGNDLP